MFTYDSIPGTATGHSLGKLVRAVRHNLYEPSVPGADFPVTETYRYEGTGGRVDQRTTVASSSGTCTQGFTWTDLGAPETVIYPTCEGAGTARTLTLGYANGLLTSVADQSRTYASSIGYHPNTMLKSVAHGNGVTVTHGLDPHAMRRPGSIATSGVTGAPGNWASGAYAYDGAGNITRTGEEWYTYDAVSRLAANSYPEQEGECPTSLQSLAYTYDPLGNMTSWTYNCSGTHTYSVDPSTNRLTTQAYDPAGNALTTVGEANTETLAYYPFNDLRSAVGTGLNRLYGYTADGERLVDYDAQPNPPAGPFTITLRDLGGKVLRSFQVTTGQPGTWTEREDWITRDGQLLATVDTTVQGGVARHVHLDHLGTPRLITSASGAGLESHTYLPFGLEVTEVGPLFERMKFTGHERDLASGLDYMHARYYNPNVARFLSVDPGRDVDPTTPQSWNMYAYVRNNPVNQTDPDGNAVNLLWDIPDLAIGAVSIGNLWVKALSGQQITVSDNIDALSGAVGMLPFVTGTAVAGKLVTFASRADDAADAAKATEGVYEVTAKSGKGYVGQSSNMPRRMNEHVAAGKVTPEAAANAKTTPVAGGKTAREVAEQKRINERGGIRELENKRNPIGEKRRHLLDEEKKQ